MLSRTNSICLSIDDDTVSVYTVSSPRNKKINVHFNPFQFGEIYRYNDYTHERKIQNKGIFIGFTSDMNYCLFVNEAQKHLSIEIKIIHPFDIIGQISHSFDNPFSEKDKTKKKFYTLIVSYIEKYFPYIINGFNCNLGTHLTPTYQLSYIEICNYNQK